MIDLRSSQWKSVHTPALVIDMDDVEWNISTTLRLLDHRPERWRPHVKTAKLAATIDRMVAEGVRQFKCSTTLELLTVCKAGATDVLVAYPLVTSRLERVLAIAREFPNIAISGLVESAAQLPSWPGQLGIFIDINPGMNRTGVSHDDPECIMTLARGIAEFGLSLRGLHYYDGNRREPNLPLRQAAAFAGYEKLLCIIRNFEKAGISVPEVVTSGTPALPCSLAFAPFQNGGFIHRVSAGTVIYNDTTSLAQLPSEWGYRPAATVLATVISHPAQNLITLDAGHKTVSADRGDPTCAVVGYPGLTPEHPSEEHLPVRVADGAASLQLGEQVVLVPRHVCPTVNNFDHAVIVRDGKISGVARVTARGREAPLRETFSGSV
ncbi:MAG: alanine racemase [Acidobacteriaceae bacterium]